MDGTGVAQHPSTPVKCVGQKGEERSEGWYGSGTAVVRVRVVSFRVIVGRRS